MKTNDGSTSYVRSRRTSWGYSSIEKRLDLNMSVNLEDQEDRLKALLECLEESDTQIPQDCPVTIIPLHELVSTVDLLEEELAMAMESVDNIAANFYQWRNQMQQQKMQRQPIGFSVASSKAIVTEATKEKKEKTKKMKKHRPQLEGENQEEPDERNTARTPTVEFCSTGISLLNSLELATHTTFADDEDAIPELTSVKKTTTKSPTQVDEESIANAQSPTSVDQKKSKKKKKKSQLQNDEDSVTSAWTTGDIANKKKKHRAKTSRKDDVTMATDHAKDGSDEDAKKKKKKKQSETVTVEFPTNISLSHRHNDGAADKDDISGVPGTKNKKKKSPTLDEDASIGTAHTATYDDNKKSKKKKKEIQQQKDEESVTSAWTTGDFTKKKKKQRAKPIVDDDASVASYQALDGSEKDAKKSIKKKRTDSVTVEFPTGLSLLNGTDGGDAYQDDTSAVKGTKKADKMKKKSRKPEEDGSVATAPATYSHTKANKTKKKPSSPQHDEVSVASTRTTGDNTKKKKRKEHQKDMVDGHATVETKLELSGEAFFDWKQWRKNQAPLPSIAEVAPAGKLAETKATRKVPNKFSEGKKGLEASQEKPESKVKSTKSQLRAKPKPKQSPFMKLVSL